MDAVWAQVLVGLGIVIGPFLGAALGAAALAWMPLRDPPDNTLHHRAVDGLDPRLPPA